MSRKFDLLGIVLSRRPDFAIKLAHFKDNRGRDGRHLQENYLVEFKAFTRTVSMVSSNHYERWGSLDKVRRVRVLQELPSGYLILSTPPKAVLSSIML